MDIELRLDEYLAMGEKPPVTYHCEKVVDVIVDRHTPYDDYYIRTELRSYPARAGTILDVSYDTMIDDILNHDELDERTLVVRSEEVRAVEIVRGEHSIIMAATSEGVRAIVRRKYGSLPPLWKEA